MSKSAYRAKKLLDSRRRKIHSIRIRESARIEHLEREVEMLRMYIRDLSWRKAEKKWWRF